MVIKSANQLIYEYYHDISVSELKAYALVQLAYMFYTVYNRGKHSLLFVVFLLLSFALCLLSMRFRVGMHF